jgi:hypothetical protein
MNPPDKAAPKMGRPRLEEVGKSLKAIKPWAKLKMSRATWYRRQLEQRKSIGKQNDSPSE